MTDTEQIINDALNRYNNARMLLELYMSNDDKLTPMERLEGSIMFLIMISMNYFIIHKHINKLL